MQNVILYGANDRPIRTSQWGALNINFADEKGIGYGIKQIDGKPRVSSVPYLYDIVEGNVPDHNVISKFGYNATVGATLETIWEESALYSYLSSATTLKITSSDTKDTSAGVGARTVELYGQDGNYDEIGEIVSLNGQTAVNTTKTYLRIYRMIVRSAGSELDNAGTIYAGTGTITTGVPANKYATITAGNNQTLMALFTIPRSYIGYLASLQVSAGLTNKPTLVCLFVRPFGEVFQVKRVFHIGEGSTEHGFAIPLPITGKSDIEIRASTSGGGGAVSASFDLWYEKR